MRLNCGYRIYLGGPGPGQPGGPQVLTLWGNVLHRGSCRQKILVSSGQHGKPVGSLGRMGWGGVGSLPQMVTEEQAPGTGPCGWPTTALEDSPAPVGACLGGLACPFWIRDSKAQTPKSCHVSRIFALSSIIFHGDFRAKHFQKKKKKIPKESKHLVLGLTCGFLSLF